MPVTAKIQPITQDLQLLLSDVLTPKGQQEVFAEFARTEVEEAKETNRQALGYDARVNIFVDGQLNKPIEAVQNVVVADFQLIDALIMWIHNQLIIHSPTKSGRYKQGHALFIDGQQFAPVQPPIPFANEYVFVNLLPYARKIERGSSSHAPNGVYEVVAHLARQQFSTSVGQITFSYRTALQGFIVGGKIGDRSERRNPAIIIKGRGF